ncbi:hypothetical protein ACTJLC_10185 [Paraburkholderia sp. 22099]|jgi:hypothetical protein|uniref:Uncharacterized protein n=1 Tax=Paraburkholderia terricola TaxID=169427 RepID=A0ABU1LUB7_9BURK|nr:hypothetical protein [Paraburkholderia terricola]MDR6410367.1 hypothetical protein [Paraburkholderia terricola]MDR6444241.1 hypothetical protein [Paraburkholderia terricola]MDR6481527.1 hypothetical protein [Paraburkholderia terricola]MDR6491687.1 hypothetical protein [Paraburkholderia terricola]
MKKQTGCREEFHHFYRLGFLVAFREFRMGCVSFAPWPPLATPLCTLDVGFAKLFLVLDCEYKTAGRNTVPQLNRNETLRA